MSSWNITTTEVTSTDFLPTSLFTTLLRQTNEGPPDGKEPGPKGKEGGGGEPSAHSENIGWKQALSVLSIIFMCLFIILSLLQIVIHKNCYGKFRKTQFRNAAGKIFFVLLIISLVTFFMNAIAFIHFIFNMDQLTETQYVYSLIFSQIPYRIGKLAMGLFFILRLHFVFRASVLKINKWIIITLIVLSVASALLGCVAGTLGPLKVIRWSPEQKGVHPLITINVIGLAITIFVDVIVMIYYVQRLMAVVVMQGEVSYVSSHRSSTAKSIELASTTKSVSASDAESEYEEEEVLTTNVTIDHKLVATITKSTLLSLIGILTSLWLHLQYSLTDKSDAVLFRAIASVDGAVNVICMYLIFSFAKPYYDSGCKLCHIAMSKCCIFVTKKAIIKAREKNQTNCGTEV